MVANAADNSELYLNIRRIGLDVSKTDVRNAGAYQNSPIQALKADSQEFIKGVWDTALEYKVGELNWDNALFMEYGSTTLKPYNKDAVVNENADKILLSSDLAWACWNFGDLKFGPLGRVAYQTEFKANGGVPRQNLVRVNAGLSLFDHPIIKSLYLTGLYEYDFTYAGNPVNKGAVEGGVSQFCTASALQMHPDAWFFCDEAAAAKLKLKKYYAWRGREELARRG